MPDSTRRLTRLLDVLPRVYTAQPDASAVGTLLRTMAGALAQLDDDMRRVLHDRWLGLATGAVGADGSPGALDQLGQLLDTPRLLPRDGTPPEGTEAFRARLGITARTLTGGLATPQAILALALADLGLEPCPLMETKAAPESGALWRVDATIAWGVKPGTRRTCPACRSGLPGPCPNRTKSLADAWINENPATARTHEEPALVLWRDFAVASASLEADRPVLRLSPFPGAGVLAYPALQNRDTGEIVLFADVLQPGQTLLLQSTATAEETRPFDGFDSSPHHEWLAQYRAGRATVTDTVAPRRDVSSHIFLISGARFNELTSVFDGTGFSELGPAVRMPLIQPGTQTWRLMSLPDPASRFDNPASTYAEADATEGTRFAQWDSGIGELTAEQALMLFDRLVQAEKDAASDPHGGERKPVASLSFTWMVRPPASFRLRIPRNAVVDRARALGALDLLLADLAAARPAGVRADIDFPEPALRDAHPVSDSFAAALGQRWRERTAIGEHAPAVTLGKHVRERHGLNDSAPVWSGLFDVTRLDGSVLQ